MFLPRLEVSPIDRQVNAQLICRYVSPEQQKNKTRPFLEKTLAMYPELRETVRIKDDKIRNAHIYEAVYCRLDREKEKINDRILYFSQKFDTFIYDFIAAQCNTYNYIWKKKDPVILCDVGYIPFYPRSTKNKQFFVSFNDEERVFSGAVHEINHMIFYEKWNEMQGVENAEEKYFPDPLWFLEEIIVDPTLNDKNVKPYTLYENRAYDQFYQPLIQNRSPMNYIKEMYESKVSIERFLEEAYVFVCNNMDSFMK
ncbi:hypothetical protein [Anaerosporobacter faecicola]|uniref:hypothetical protein n=1 Tax=Anaerosporobacter faecicola TaxID=2718714 RepID=UPI00143B77E1|nr:hypothetical protein [Anaerosporobacter faecicola]